MARRVPTNYGLLAAFTFCQAFYFSYLTTNYSQSNVLSAAIMTAGMTAGITTYAFHTKRDFTTGSSLMVTLSIALLLLCLCSVFLTFTVWWHPIICFLLVVMYGMYLIYDVQLIAGSHQYSLNNDEYIVGAMLVFVDIMWLFVEILRVLGDKK